jgi:endonuclease/exonuclease/phosphatase family metal-dependent hydrolase
MKPAEIRVMTFNIRHGRGMDDQVDLDRIAMEIERSGADIIGLQEVDRFLSRSDAIDQTAQLADRLGMQYSYSASEDAQNDTRLAHLIRDNNATTGENGGYGNALLSRFPITGHQQHYLASTRERRSVLQTDIDINGQQITVCVTHLGLDEEEQMVQVHTIATLLQNIRGEIILMGDFNVKADSPVLAQLLPHLSKVLLPGNVTTFAGRKDAIVEIDHIFTNLTPLKPAWTQPTTASDHHPLLAQLALNS